MNCAKLLLENYADPNFQDKHGYSVLSYLAADRAATVIIRLLLEHGADPNFQNKKGDTALHSAALYSKPTHVKVLLEHHANPNIVNKEGKTPLDLSHDSRVSSLLKQYGGVHNKSFLSRLFH